MLKSTPVFLKFTRQTDGSLVLVCDLKEIPPGAASVVVQFDVDLDERLFDNVIRTGARLVIAPEQMDAHLVVAGIRRIEAEARELTQ